MASIISTMQLINFFILFAFGLTLNFCVPNHLEAVSTFGLFLLPSLSREGQGGGSPYPSSSPPWPPPVLPPPWFLRPFGSKRHPIGMPSGRLRRRK